MAEPDLTQPSKPEDSGRGGIVDTTNPAQAVKDARLACRAVREGWGVPPDVKREVVDACADLVRMREPRSMLFAARLLIDADKVDQADQHLAEKNARLDAGKATERVEAPIKFIKGVDEAKL